MAWRVICIEKPAYLHLKNNNLVVRQENEFFIPLEDIDVLVLDNYNITITQKLVLALSQSKVTTIICDESHMPSANLLSYSQASRGARNARIQLGLPKPTMKQLWRRNIIAKINNQADVLAKNGLCADDLKKLATTVRSGDIGNNESIAARLYFSRLLEEGVRHRPTWNNFALNYGYALVRSCIAKSVAARGLIASIGINHRSELNQYNLVDDLIESLRPIVDDYILANVAPKRIFGDGNENLTKGDKKLILALLNSGAIMLGKKYTIKQVCDLLVEGFLSAILEDNIDSFMLPEVIK